jgi:hypothetical protein
LLEKKVVPMAAAGGEGKKLVGGGLPIRLMRLSIKCPSFGLDP